MKLKGIGASDGYAIAKAYRFEQAEIEVVQSSVGDVGKEIERFQSAIYKSILELEKIKEKIAKEIDAESAAIFGAHIEILNDPELIGAVKAKIEDEKVNCDYALQEVTNMFIAIFDTMDDPYIKERAADIKDVSKRVIRNIHGIEVFDPSAINEEVVVIAEDLTPSDTAQLNKQFVKGFVTSVGGRTGHSAIMARTLEIPAVVGTKTAFDQTKNDEPIIVDGFSGEVFVNPDAETIMLYNEKINVYNEKKLVWAQMKGKPTETLDKVHVELTANIGGPQDIEGVLENSGEGVGLYRTEFLYMGKNRFPTEDEQFESYKIVLEKMEGKPVVIRTLDIGGDKKFSYLDLPGEMNPFLGNRAIRLCLNNQDMFRTQLRALLRASVYGNLKIMFPMIATIQEFLDAKTILLDVKEELVKEGHEVSDTFELGIMVEIPATVLLADLFAKEVDFFSIGTNDLIQYTFAADRMNEKVSYLYQPYNPSLIRMVKQVIEAAHAEGKWVGMCGEMAGESNALPILLGLGLDEFSMSATSILEARYLLSKMTKEDAVKLANAAMTKRTQDEVLEVVNAFMARLK